MKNHALVAVLFLVIAFLIGAQTSRPASAQVRHDLWRAEWSEMLRHMSLVYLDDGQGGVVKTIRFTGVNVQVVNGLQATNGYPADPLSLDPAVTQVNGLGNLILGYNEVGNPNGDLRTGSHNVVFGRGNTYSSFGGMVGPLDNTVSGAYATVTGGQLNLAIAPGAAVTGGSQNLASGLLSSVSGGSLNTATDPYSTVSGGSQNLAKGTSSSVSGGAQNTASGTDSVVTGGRGNQAKGYRSAIGGGSQRSVTGTDDWRAGSLLEDD